MCGGSHSFHRAPFFLGAHRHVIRARVIRARHVPYGARASTIVEIHFLRCTFFKTMTFGCSTVNLARAFAPEPIMAMDSAACRNLRHSAFAIPWPPHASGIG